MPNLVIVESPSKAATIKGYLGANYKVVASKGHVRDLPKSTLGVDIENDFAPHYINIRGKGDLIKEIKKEASLREKYFLRRTLTVRVRLSHGTLPRLWVYRWKKHCVLPSMR